MTLICYAGCALALISALLVITAREPMHALLYLVMMLLALALVFFTLGAPFVAAVQLIVYVGAIMVLFVFVVMMLNLAGSKYRERRWLAGPIWGAPLMLAAALLGLCAYALAGQWGMGFSPAMVGPKAVGMALYRDYLLGVEIVSLLLVAALVAAFHFAPRPGRTEDRSGEAGDG